MTRVRRAGSTGARAARKKGIFPNGSITRKNRMGADAIVPAAPEGSGVPGRHDARAFHHEDDRPLRRPRAMDHALGHHEPLTRTQLHRALFQIDEKATLHDVEKLILVVVLVPM